MNSVQDVASRAPARANPAPGYTLIKVTDQFDGCRGLSAGLLVLFLLARKFHVVFV
jgi:hypothetical protein